MWLVDEGKSKAVPVHDAWSEVSGQIHVPVVLPLGKELPVPIAGLDDMERRTILTHSGLGLRPQLVDSRYIYCTIPALLLARYTRIIHL
jgi:hypothetical protein